MEDFNMKVKKLFEEVLDERKDDHEYWKKRAPFQFEKEKKKKISDLKSDLWNLTRMQKGFVNEAGAKNNKRKIEILKAKIKKLENK